VLPSTVGVVKHSEEEAKDPRADSEMNADGEKRRLNIIVGQSELGFRRDAMEISSIFE